MRIVYLQVENVAASLSSDVPRSSNNLADEIQSILTRLSNIDEDFVRAINVQLRHSPSVTLFTEDQVNDIRMLCGKDTKPDLRSVLSFDRTFNLSNLYVTVMVFRHTKVLRKKTQQSPIFIGPMMLHGDGKYATYLNFFSTVNGALSGCTVDTGEFRVQDGLVTGSDEETAMVNAARTAFPNSRHLFCLIHCKDNVRHHLTTIGVPTPVREHVLSLLFGCNGIAEAPDEQELDNRTAELLQYVRQNNVDAVEYLQQRIVPKIANNNRLKWEESWIGQRQWTNNNCESANNLLKVEVNFVPTAFFACCKLCI